MDLQQPGSRCNSHPPACTMWPTSAAERNSGIPNREAAEVYKDHISEVYRDHILEVGEIRSEAEVDT